MRYLILIFQLLALPCMAGPWLRDAGTGFAAVTLASKNGTELRYFGEYGLNERLTIGASVLHSTDGNLAEGEVFARLPLHQGQTWISAAEIGLGFSNTAPGRPEARAGLTLGRGLPQGWLSGQLDLSRPLRDTGAQTWEAHGNLTLGHNLSDHFTLIGQLDTERTPSQQRSSATAGAIYTLRDGVRIAGEVNHPFDGGAQAISLSLWTDF